MLHLILLDVSQKEERGGCRQTAKDRKLMQLGSPMEGLRRVCGPAKLDLVSQARLRGLEQRSRINTSVRARKSVKRE